MAQVQVKQQQRQFAVAVNESLNTLQLFGKKNGVKINTIFNTAWALVLGTYSGTEQVVFASTFEEADIRTTEICEPVVDKVLSILDVLKSIEDSANHNINKENEGTSQSTKPNDRPLQDSCVYFQAGHSSRKNVPDESIVLEVKFSGDKLSLILNYSKSGLEEEQAVSISETFTKALSIVLHSPQQTIGEIDLTSNRDLATIWSWNQVLPRVVDECVHDCIKRQVDRQPEATAICAWDGTMTYHELDISSTRLAHHLVDVGVGPEVVIPLCFEKSLWAIVACLGVVKAGGAVVFIDPSHPSTRREEITGQISATMILTSNRQAKQWEQTPLSVCIVDQNFIEGLRYQKQYPNVKIHPNNVLYVIFTSGSTGIPKGCIVEHASFCTGATAQAAAANITPSSRILQLASYTFDVSLLEILTALMHGACICTPNEESMVEGIASLINKYGITWAFLTPSLIKVLSPSEVPGLKTLVLGGEALSKSDVETWANHVQLGNGYGPSECSVAAAGNPGLTSMTNPANIGHALGGLCWIVDASDHNKLVPIGAVGELLIEGRIVARGYLNNPGKTAEAFITAPAWGPQTASGTRRLYKTGDLARYNRDGTIHFIARKDTQIKLRGFRIELGEIEHHISVHESVRHAIVLLPKNGHCKQRLVVVLSMKEFQPTTPGDSEIRLVPVELKNSAQEKIAKIREHLSGLVPSYMVPETWVLVESIPLGLSGKMARVPVLKWVTEMDDETYRKIAGVELQDEEDIEMTWNESQLRLVYSDVLNLAINQIPLDKSFISLGGDSISAMQVMSRCRTHGLAVTVKDIIRHKSISELALRVVSTSDSKINKAEEFDRNFDLSPVQLMYFQVTPPDTEGSLAAHYNQSFFLRLTRATPVENLVQAFEAVVTRHSMLRARMIEVEDGKWQQYVMKQVEGSYGLESHDLDTLEDTSAIIASAQKSLNLFHGPVFAAHIFNMQEGDQFFFLVAHHAVIDLVSWRVILRDLEDAINTGKVLTEKPLPYQAWLELQAENARDHGNPRAVLPFEVPPPNIEYWGMAGQSNSIRDTREDIVKLDSSSTTRLMGIECHTALRTEPIDLILSVLMHSFTKTFSDRPSPTIFREGHGREPWDNEIDISETVGWFTTMFPLCINTGPRDDIVEFTRQVKDNRYAILDNGRPYFASRFLNEKGIEAFGHHNQVEICFDYLGLYQQLERPDALLRQEPRTISATTADIGIDVQRFALMEITAEMISGRMQFSFVYNLKMKNQEKIQQWISEIPRCFAMAMDRLAEMEKSYTLSDFPMLAITYDGLSKLLNKRLPEMGISNPEEVQDIYPCSPMQQGLLISQSRASGFYEYSHTIEIVSTTPEPVNVNRLKEAWQKVVQRHSALRTIFFRSEGTLGAYDQLVLKKVSTRSSSFKCEDDEVDGIFRNQTPISFEDIEPPHRLTICETTSGRVLCKLEFNHAIIDGGSMPVILKDFAMAYDNLIPAEEGPLFGDYISYLRSLPQEVAISHWKEYLQDLEPTYFPILEGSDEDPQLREIVVHMKASTAEIQQFCLENNLTLSNIFQTAWGLVLRAYTGLDDVCFGYLSSGRDSPVSDFESAVGPFITMLVCRLVLHGAASVAHVLETVQEDFLQSLPHQHCSLAEIQHALHLSGQPLFNTVMSFQKAEDAIPLETTTIAFNALTGHDPTEYNISLDVMVSDKSVATTLGYWTSAISSEQAGNLAGMLSQAMDCILLNFRGEVNDIDLLGEGHLRQIMTWNSELPPPFFQCVHTIFEEQVAIQPNAPAICSFDGDLTYAELDVLSTKLAHHLVFLGVGPEVLVPFCFHKSTWAIVTIVAILKAGGACVPLDSKQPLNRLKTIINMTSANLVICAPQNIGLFEGLVEDVVAVDLSFVEKLPNVVEKPCRTVRPDNAMYVIFSSGTTGVPKGILLEHSSIATMGQGMKEKLRTGPGDRVLQFAAYTYDVSIGDIFGALMLGACVCNVSDHDRMNNLAGALQIAMPTIAEFTPTVASLIRPSDAPTLRVLSFGGESLTKDAVDIWAGKVDMICNTYGPAECSVTSTYNCHVQNGSSLANVGYPVACRGWIVSSDNHNKLAPLGSVGELLIEGPLLARGYLKDPERTREVFIQNPVWSQRIWEGNRRFYKTGDLARYNHDGTIHLVGRADTQVKIHGQRVELSEIESHITAHMPSLQQVTAEAISLRGHGRKSLAVFFVSSGIHSEGSPDDLATPLSVELRKELRALQAFLGTVLQSYMIPSMYIAMRRMPLNASGKLSRSTIRDIAAEFSEAQQLDYSLQDSINEPPSTEMEKKLQQIWSCVLGIPAQHIGKFDSFLRLGGDSVVAMRLVAAARASDIVISVANIFRYPELSKMALAVESSDGVPAVKDFAPFCLVENLASLEGTIAQAALQCGVERRLIEDIYPCSPLQEALLAISTRQQRAYIARMVFKLPTTLDRARFQSVWRRAMASEPILRTRIIHNEAGSLQVVIRDDEIWHTAKAVDEYVENDKKIPMQYGKPLHRLALISEEHGNSYFVWTIHHALYDGQSQYLLLKQIERLYMGEPISKAPPYKRFIEYLTNTDQAMSDEFWKSQLLKRDIPTSFPQLPSSSYQARADQLEMHSLDLSRKGGSVITSATIMKAAWAMVVAQYSNSDDVIFAMTLSGRTAPVPGISEMTGPTITTVPLRIQMRQKSTIFEYLERVQNQHTEMIPYEHTGLQNIRHVSLGDKYDLDLKHLFVFQPTSKNDDSFLDLEPIPTDEADFNTYALVIQCSYEDGQVTIEARYDGRIIEVNQMRRMLYQFENVIRQLNDESTFVKLEDVEVFSPQDLQLVQIWNSEKLESVDCCIHEVIGKQVLSRPAATLAVSSWDGDLTYRELDSLSSRLALHLIGIGVGPGIFVPLCFDKSVWTIVSMLAVLKAGGAYFSLSPSYPLSHLRGIIHDIGASIILVGPQHCALFENIVPTVIQIQALFDTLPATDTGISFPVHAHSPAFVVFTSGSTGKSKGVVIEHRTMVTMAYAEGQTMQFDTNTRVLHFASSTFDVSNSEVLTTLMFGGCVCVPSDIEKLNDLTGVINRRRANWLFLTPAMADIIEPTAVPTLKTLVLGGEAIRQDLLDRWADKVTLINSYGPSETTIWTSNSHLQPTARPANIGRGLGCHTWVTQISNHDRLAPVGCVGELLVEGPILARCYINDPEKTDAAFISNPIWARDGKSPTRRFYKTGDLVRYNSDGSLDYIGRKDTQVKLRGQRIELGSIEHHIKTNLPDVQQVAADVVVPKGFAGDKSLVAFIQLKSTDLEMDSEAKSQLIGISKDLQTKMLQLQSSLAASLPPYMVPSLFMIFKRLPSTPSGKLDRKEMRRIVSELTKAELSPYSLANGQKRPPSTLMEQKLQNLWARVLHLETSSIGADDNFFQIGADSISAMRLTALSRTENMSISVADVFRNPILFEMARIIDNFPLTSSFHLEPFCLLGHNQSSRDIIEEAASICSVELEAIEDVYPCTPLQENLFEISIRNKSAYTAQNVFRLPASLDLIRFKAMWQILSDEHSILRTRIIDKALQVVVRERITWQHGSTLDGYLQADSAKGVKFGAPLCRYAIVDGHFIWTAHHAVYDGWSMTLLFEQLQNLYDGGDIPRTTPYNGFIHSLLNVDRKASDTFWESQLSGDRPASFPEVLSLESLPRPDRVHSHNVSVPLNSKSEVLMSTVLRAAWAMVVGRHSGSNDVVFAMALSGRNFHTSGIENVMGPTITTVPMRMRLDPGQSIADYLQDAQKQMTEMIPFAHIGLQNILGSKNQIDLKHLFVIQSSDEDGGNEVLGMKSVSLDMAGFDSYGLVVECLQRENSIDIEVRYDQSIISPARIERMVYLFEHLVQQLSKGNSPSTALGEMDFFSPQDAQQVAAWNRTQPAIHNKCVHELFQERAFSQMDAPAILSWDGNFTYAKLDIWSNQLAHHLVSVGVGPEVMVPVCFDKSALAIVAMLAILKAGGACVAINPEHPPNRLQHIIKDVKASVILTTKRYVHLFQGLNIEIVSPNNALLKKYPRTSAFMPIKPENPAFVVFTSGSTGAPKGIILEHRALCSSIYAHGAAMRLDVNSRVLQFAAYTFDVSIGEIFSTFVFGGCVCVPSEDERMNDLPAFMNRMDVNWAYLTPTIASLLHPEEVPGLKTLSLGGEALTRENISVWADEVYLINIYGPAETSIWSTALCGVKPETPPSNLGYGIGASMWVAEVSNHNLLCPIGCVGELLIEGPILARGYINLEEKTRASFITNPPWATGHSDRRFYKTGDLVRFSADGMIDYVGRKDAQFKLHGQRIEASEIEHHLSTDRHVRHSMILLPKTNSGQQRLTAILSLESSAGHTSKGKPKLVRSELAELEVASIRKRLSDRVPGYMVPAIWLVVEEISVTVSGKINRLEMQKWVERMDEEIFRVQMEVEMSSGAEIPATDMEEKIQKILSQVLNLPTVRLDKSFLTLGGDSITAMQTRTKCRSEGIAISVQDIMLSTSITELALAAKSVSQSLVSYTELTNTPFGLSPVQQLYFDIESTQSKSMESHHFNQSFLLRITRRVGALRMARAIETIVGQHSMLRARFSQQANGQWVQRIVKDIPDSYRFDMHELAHQEEAIPLISSAETSLNIVNGPVFSADLFNISNADSAGDSAYQLLFVCAHHLVIDLVSWRIILHDLEEILESGRLSSQSKPLPFQNWSSILAEHTKQIVPGKAMPIHIEPANFDYWGMANRPNVFGDQLESKFSLDRETTDKLFGISNDAFRTEPLDILLATLIHSFGQVFNNRQSPTVFNEGHGRESWDSEIDVAGIVGWFTTMVPLHVPLENNASILEALKHTKDLRRLVPNNGFPYFGSRFLSAEGRKLFKGHSDMEILFNYQGRYQQLERDSAILRPEDFGEGLQAKDQGPNKQRFSLFEISVEVVQSQTWISFAYNRHQLYQDLIVAWISGFKESLKEIAVDLATMEVRNTLSDFPLLPLDYNGLERFQHKLSELGISQSQVEDLYPTSPMQRSMLLTQQKIPGTYGVQNIYDVSRGSNSVVVDTLRLRNAWQKVVERHASLRTIFIPSVSGTGGFDQIVLSGCSARIEYVECDNDSLSTTIASQKSIDYREARPHNLFTIFKTTSKVVCKIEISHALSDGASMRLLIRDLNIAYGNNIQLPPRPLYRDYISFLQQQSSSESRKYWKSYLSTVKYCHFPHSNFKATLPQVKEQRNVRVSLNEDFSHIQAFCKRNNFTAANLFQATWGLVLRHYTGNNETNYGYLTSGRDVPVDDVSDLVGTAIHMLLYRQDIKKSTTVSDLLKETRTDFLTSLPYQFGFVDAVQSYFQAQGSEQPLFNTIMSLQYTGGPEEAEMEPSLIKFKHLGGQDPNQYDLSIAIDIGNTSVEVCLAYWSTITTDENAYEIAGIFAKTVTTILAKPEAQIFDLDLSL